MTTGQRTDRRPEPTGQRSDPRPESQAQRDDRNLAELLQELRVAGLGVQVLFGFLLSLPFTSRFTRLTHFQRELYLVTLLLAAASIALLVGPVAYHRMVFRRRQKERLVRAASVMAILGLASVCLAISAAVLLVSSFVAESLAAGIITAIVAGLFAGLWFAFPLVRREDGDETASGDTRGGNTQSGNTQSGNAGNGDSARQPAIHQNVPARRIDGGRPSGS